MVLKNILNGIKGFFCKKSVFDEISELKTTFPADKVEDDLIKIVADNTLDINSKK